MSLAQALNVCRFLPTAGGTTDWTYSSAVTGYQSPAVANAINGATYHYRAESADLSQWEIGEGTYNSGTGVFTRTTVFSNSSGGTSKINFSTVPQVAIVLIKEDVRNPIIPGARLTLASGTPITESDVVGATTIYHTPSPHNIVECWNATTSSFDQFEVDELSLALDSNSGHTGYHQSGKQFHLGVFQSGGVPVLGSGVAWSSDTATGTGAGTCEVEIWKGRLVNKVSMTVRFGSASGNTVSVAARQFTIVGAFRASADGQAEDSLLKRYLSNLYNVAIRPMKVIDAATSWNYSTAINRQANANAANQCDWFHCVAGRAVSLSLKVLVTNNTSTVRNVQIGIGIDSTTVIAGAVGFVGSDITRLWSVEARYNGLPTIGRHIGVWIEQGNGSDTQTWYSFGGAVASLEGWTIN